MYTLPAEVITALQNRLNDEWFAVNMYQGLSMYFRNSGSDLAAKWAENESKEEIEHAERIQNHLTGWNTIPARTPQQMDFSFSSLTDALQQAYEVEHALYLAYAEDYKNLAEYPSCQVFITKFLKIQDESVIALADKLRKLEGITGAFELRQIEQILFN